MKLIVTFRNFANAPENWEQAENNRPWPALTGIQTFVCAM
jgi:hypothetical protein